MGAADASGLVVSYIQSLYWEFGSGCVLPATGVLMQNRGASFSLDPKALNALAPGRRPFHTLNPALAALKDGRVIAYGTMGGDGQPQTQAAVFTRHVTVRPAARAGARRAALAARPHLGLDAHQLAPGVPLRRKPDRPPDVGRPRRRRCSTSLIPTPWAMPARSCCIRTARWKAATIRAPTAARRGFSSLSFRGAHEVREPGIQGGR